MPPPWGGLQHVFNIRSLKIFSGCDLLKAKGAIYLYITPNIILIFKYLLNLNFYQIYIQNPNLVTLPNIRIVVTFQVVNLFEKNETQKRQSR